MSTSYITQWMVIYANPMQTIQTVGLLDDWLLVCVIKEAKMKDRKYFSSRWWDLKLENIGDFRKNKPLKFCKVTLIYFNVQLFYFFGKFFNIPYILPVIWVAYPVFVIQSREIAVKYYRNVGGLIFNRIFKFYLKLFLCPVIFNSKWLINGLITFVHFGLVSTCVDYEHSVYLFSEKFIK